MCPACLTSAALLITGIVTTGGAGALIARVIRKKPVSTVSPASKGQVHIAKEKSS